MNTQDTLDISVLPQEVRIQLIDFYEYLIAKYRVPPTSKNKKRFSEFVETPIKVAKMIRINREDLYDRKSGIY